jgi:hypothetical protein
MAPSVNLCCVLKDSALECTFDSSIYYKRFLESETLTIQITFRKNHKLFCEILLPK